MTKRMRLSVSNRQKWGSAGTLLVHADLQLKCLLLHVDRCVEPDLSHCWGWGIGWRCALCCMYAQWCIELETTYRGLSGWGVKRKEGKQTDMAGEVEKARCWKLGKNKRYGSNGCSLSSQTVWTTWNWELLSLPLTSNISVCAKYHLWGNSIIFIKIVWFAYHICILLLICTPILLSFSSCI